MRIDDLGCIVTGKTPSTRNPAFFDGPYYFVRPSDIDFRNYYCRATKTTVTDEAKTRHKHQFIPENAVMITCIGNTIGKCAISSEYCMTNQQINSIIPHPDFNPRFVYYLMLFNEQVIREIGLSGGSATPIINKSTFSNIRVKLPPKPVRDAIADILSTYDNLIENNRRRIMLLEQAARLLYREWFVHLRFPGHEHVNITTGLPGGWRKRHLSELVDTQYGFTETASQDPVGPKFLRGMDINKAPHIDWSTVPYCPEEKLDFPKYALAPGDIVVIRMADPGKVAIIEKEIKAVFASYLVRMKLKADAEIPPLYIYYVLSDNKYQRFIAGASEKSTRKSASAKLLTDFNLVEPPRSLLLLFAEQIQSLRQQIGVLLDQNAMLRYSRDLLLPRLMNGEIAI